MHKHAHIKGGQDKTSGITKQTLTLQVSTNNETEYLIKKKIFNNLKINILYKIHLI